MRFVALLGMMLLTSACALLPSGAPLYSRVAEPLPGYGNVYIYRINAYPLLRAPKIIIDGQRVFDPPENAYTVIALTEGPHELHVDWAWDTAPDFRFSFQVMSGSPLYIRVSSGTGGTRKGLFSTVAKIIAPSQAESELKAGCRFVLPHKELMKADP